MKLTKGWLPSRVKFWMLVPCMGDIVQNSTWHGKGKPNERPKNNVTIKIKDFYFYDNVVLFLW
jgi:hypothetical protein